MRTLASISCILIAGFVAGGPARAGDEELRRFRTEYPKAVISTTESLNRLRGTIRTSMLEKERRKPEISEAEFIIDKNNCRLTFQPKASLGGRLEQLVVLKNEAGTYNLRRNSPDGTYALSDFELAPRSTGIFESFFCQGIEASFRYGGSRIDELERRSGYRLVSADEIRTGGKTYMKLGVEGPPLSGTTGKYCIEFTLAPDAGWVIVAVDEYASWPHAMSTTSSRVSYENPRYPLIPSRVFSKATSNREFTYEIKISDDQTIEPMDYSLKSFGVSEPVLPTNRKSYSLGLPFFGVVGLIGLAIAWFIRRSVS